MVVLFPSKEERGNQAGVIDEGLRILWPAARKRLWMCSSWTEVEQWKGLVPPLRNGSTTHIRELRGSDESQLREFREASLGHLFTAARYDGIDFPGDQCRLAIVPSPPITSDPQEEFFSAYLQDAGFLKSRFSQRVAQALGRCNRGTADFAVYVFLDPQFERRFGGNDPDYLSYLPPDIQVEMEAALENCEDGFKICCSRATDFLSGKFAPWDSQLQTLRQETRKNAKISSSPSTAYHEVAGWSALWKGDPVNATSHFRKCANEFRKKHISGPLAFSLYCCAWARYLCHVRQNESVALEDTIGFLEKSASCGPSSWFTTILRASVNDLRKPRKEETSLQITTDYGEAVVQQWEIILYERGQREPAMKKWLVQLKKDITSSYHNEVKKGLKSLGELIGFEAFCPSDQAMPDVVWRFWRGQRDLRFVFTWEVKTQLSPGGQICVSDVNQAHGQGRWAIKNYPKRDGFRCVPFILAQCSNLESRVRDRLDNVRCMSQSALVPLVQNIISLFDEFRTLWNANDSAKRTQAKQRVCPKMANAEWLFEVCESSGPGFISQENLLSKWPSAS